MVEVLVDSFLRECGDPFRAWGEFFFIFFSENAVDLLAHRMRLLFGGENVVDL
jgi:hypothetical protein